MRAAVRHLCEKGVEALKPQKALSKQIEVAGKVAKPSREIWRRPIISKRVANDLRKQAIQRGTYGNFDTNTGIGWDPQWDLVLKQNHYYSERIGNIQPSKKTAKQRNRQDRADKLNANLQSQAAQIEEYYQEKEESRVQDKSFEARYKRMMRGGAPGGGPR